MSTSAFGMAVPRKRREISSLTRGVSVATGSVELYISGRSEGPRTKPSQILNGG